LLTGLVIVLFDFEFNILEENIIEKVMGNTTHVVESNMKFLRITEMLAFVDIIEFHWLLILLWRGHNLLRSHVIVASLAYQRVYSSVVSHILVEALNLQKVLILKILRDAQNTFVKSSIFL